EGWRAGEIPAWLQQLGRRRLEPVCALRVPSAGGGSFSGNLLVKRLLRHGGRHCSMPSVRISG
ncbi:MAG: hypothetical protein L0H63_15850, partial [Nitrococcus sp.]|nr:hypothetical protein [Nitrococcus sp.]